MIFRVFLLFLLFIGFAAAKESWQEFKERFLKKEGYIIDPYNENRTTSEAQGYGMLIAVLNNDKKAFDLIWNWTKENLQRQDYLFSWLWKDGSIKDKNNAVDADMFISYALLRAYYKWKDTKYLQEYKKISSSIKELVLPVYNGTDLVYVLFPARYGFVNCKGIKVYPSYYVPFIAEEFFLASNEKVWQGILSTYFRLIQTNLLTDQLLFSFWEKSFFPQESVSMDAYRVILYTYLYNKKLTGKLKKAFSKVDTFFQENGYIPITFYINKEVQPKQESPYCVYLWFYMVYKDKRYLNRYENLKKFDKNNYFCLSLELIKEGLMEGENYETYK